MNQRDAQTAEELRKLKETIDSFNYQKRGRSIKLLPLFYVWEIQNFF